MRKARGLSDCSGVYEIVSPSGKRYIGSAVRFSARWGQHKAQLRAARHHSPALQAAWEKYGADAFSWNVLEVTDGTRDERVAREQYYIDLLKPEYNCSKHARSRQGVPQPASCIEKVRAANKASWADPERRAKRMESMARIDQQALQAKRLATLAEKYPGGLKLSEEHRAKLVARNRARKGIPTGRVFSQETRAKISAANARLFASGARTTRGENHPMFGKTHADEAKAKMAAAKRGKPGTKRTDPTKCAKLLHDWIDGQKECRPCANAANSASRLKRLGRDTLIPHADRMTPEVRAKISATLRSKPITALGSQE